MVEIIFRNQKFQVKENIAARDALKKLGIDPESVLVTVNGKLVTDDTILREGDRVKLVAVVSGGSGQEAVSRRQEGLRLRAFDLPRCRDEM